MRKFLVLCYSVLMSEVYTAVVNLEISEISFCGNLHTAATYSDFDESIAIAAGKLNLVAPVPEVPTPATIAAVLFHPVLIVVVAKYFLIFSRKF